MIDLDDLQRLRICEKCKCVYMPEFEWQECPPHSYDLEKNPMYCSRCTE